MPEWLLMLQKGSLLERLFQVIYSDGNHSNPTKPFLKCEIITQVVLNLRSTKWGLLMGVAVWGVRGGQSPLPRTQERFQFFLKINVTIYWAILMEIFAICSKEIINFYRISRKFGQKFRKILGLYILANSEKNIVEISTETCNFY